MLGYLSPLIRRLAPHVVLAVTFAILAMLASTWLQPDRQVSVSSLQPLGMGGAESCSHAIFDELGHAIPLVPTGGWYTVMYTGAAPLRLIPDYGPGAGCPTIPSVINSTAALSGQPIYPLYLDVNLRNTRLRSGESIGLEVVANVSDQFEAGDYILPISPAAGVPITITVDGPAFDISPVVHTSGPKEISVGERLGLLWVIAPKQQSEGTQELLVSVETDFASTSFILALDVWSLGWISPALIAIIAGIGGFLASLVKVAEPLKQLFDMLKGSQPPHNKRAGGKK